MPAQDGRWTYWQIATRPNLHDSPKIRPDSGLADKFLESVAAFLQIHSNQNVPVVQNSGQLMGAQLTQCANHRCGLHLFWTWTFIGYFSECGTRNNKAFPAHRSSQGQRERYAQIFPIKCKPIFMQNSTGYGKTFLIR